jgi:hypothetical protein
MAIPHVVTKVSAFSTVPKKLYESNIFKELAVAQRHQTIVEQKVGQNSWKTEIKPDNNFSTHEKSSQN